VPLDKALDDVLIAYAMNSADLPLDHGFPMRAIVPGHYGMASSIIGSVPIISTAPAGILMA
jgi:DMSO/TMAO reductase YedYZ molybdopterin-dependent catalytic subunit